MALKYTIHIRRLLVIGVGLFSGSFHLMVRASEPLPVPVFHLAFDEGYSATSQGNGTPTNTDHLPALVEGISGKAAQFEEGSYLRYTAKDNLPKTAGSISLWVKMPVSGTGISGRRYTLFREDGPNAVGSNMTWLWLHGGTGLRFDVRDSRDLWTYIPNTDFWKKDEWHQLVTTWDSNVGVKVYVDGMLAAEQPMVGWKPKFYDGFYIGAFDSLGTQPWGSAIDEVSIYDHPLTAEEVRDNFLRFGKPRIHVQLVDPFLAAGKPGTVTVALKNADIKKSKISLLRLEVRDKDGKTVQDGKLADQDIEGSKLALLKSPLMLSSPGSYSYTLSYVENGSTHTFTGTLTAVGETAPLGATPSKLIPVAEIDASKDEPLAEAGKTTVVHSKLGDYREAGAAMHDRFAMSFEVDEVGQPHVAVITYPDDKPRTMEVLLQDLGGFESVKSRDYQAQTGIFTGDEYALTDRMLEHRVIFWPHTTKQSLIFMTAENGHPAAVHDVKIYRLDRFAAAEVKPFSGSVPARNIGLYYEDPVLHQNFGTGSELSGFMTAAERLFDYMQSFGQNVFCYPIVWYQGPLYGTFKEPRQPENGGETLGERPHPLGYPAYLLKSLQARGMKFNAGLHIHYLPSLNPYTITDLKRVVKGEETVANVQSDGTIGWGHYHGADPNYNPIDPRVMNAVNAVTDEIGDRYGQEPAFEGITLVIARVKLFSFGSIKSGYNDVNLQGFQNDTGIKIPGYDLANPQRFSDSYKWLTSHSEMKKTWIDWRCRKLHDHYKRVADSLSARRSDLKLTLNVFAPFANYPRIANYLNESEAEALRESGIDPKLYAGNSNIILSYTLVPADFRWRRSLDDETANLERTRTAMMAPEPVQSLRLLPQTGVIIHDRYWEDAVGKTSPLKLSSDTNVRECAWRVSTLNASSYNAMEPYVAALNNMDALEITKGGFLIGTFGMEDFIYAFTRQYRALPAVKFDDIAGLEDPVRVRQKVVDGKLYFYVLNRIPASIDVKLELAENGAIEEPATGKVLPSNTALAVRLAPYELRVYRSSSPQQRVVSGQTDPDKEWLAQLQIIYEQIKKNAAATGKTSPYLIFAEECRTKGQLARLHFLMQESWVNDFREK